MIYSFLLIIIISILTLVDLKHEKYNLASPIFLFSIMQIVVIGIQILAYIGWGLRPKYCFNFGSFILIMYSYMAFYIGNYVAKNKSSLYFYKNKENSLPFYSTAIIGIIGTTISLKNMNIGRNVLILLITNFNYFDEQFKMSSLGSILWLSNIAALFWSNYAKKNKLNNIISLICFINIFFRAAYLYIIIAAFYYFIPKLVINDRRSNKKLLGAIIILGILIAAIPFISYSKVDIKNGSYIIKIYPYTAGCLSNLAYNGNDIFLTGPENYNNIKNIFRDLGFGQIMQYIDKYFNTNLYLPIKNNNFLPQIEGIDEEGNMSSIYISVFKNPLLIGLIYMFFLGFLSKKLMKTSAKSIFAMSCYCFFSAANFLSFSGGGHFATTRFFPALLFIWPFIVFHNLVNTTYNK